nr:MAG TPA: hypothetical protein [Caudoviricetes sp.]
MVRQRVTVHAASNHQCTSSTLRRLRAKGNRPMPP